MSERMTKPVAQESKNGQPIPGFTTVTTAVAVFAVLVATAVYAQDKYPLKSPGGIAFSDFRGYEDWATVSSARTDEVLKVIVGNPTMIEAYKNGIPGKGQPFPDGSHDRETSMETEEERGSSVPRGRAGRFHPSLCYGEGQ